VLVTVGAGRGVPVAEDGECVDSRANYNSRSHRPCAHSKRPETTPVRKCVNIAAPSSIGNSFEYIRELGAGQPPLVGSVSPSAAVSCNDRVFPRSAGRALPVLRDTSGPSSYRRRCRERSFWDRRPAIIRYAYCRIFGTHVRSGAQTIANERPTNGLSTTHKQRWRRAPFRALHIETVKVSRLKYTVSQPRNGRILT